MLEHRGTPLFIIGIVFFLIVFGGASFYVTHKNHVSELRIGGTNFVTEVAATPMAREQGLSGRYGLGQNRAMLFTFDANDTQCFWMRDMKFAIDMVWLNEQQKITAIERSVEPATYPNNFCHPGKNVIELSAGTADKLNLHEGDQVDL